jgi:hypothetical protein
MSERRIPQFLNSVLMAAAAASLLLAASPVAAGNAKVEICHIPPGNPDNFHTLVVGTKALSAHLAHGDLGGACDTQCEVLCDDGDACTIDACDSSGSCAATAPVSCDDGDPCTTDTCDPAIGCRGEPVTCEPPDACTVSMCAPDTGECVDSPVVCGPGEACIPEADPVCQDLSCPCFTAFDLDQLVAECVPSAEFPEKFLFCQGNDDSDIQAIICYSEADPPWSARWAVAADPGIDGQPGCVGQETAPDEEFVVTQIDEEELAACYALLQTKQIEILDAGLVLECR